MGIFNFQKFFPESKTAKKFDTTQRIIISGDLAKTWLENRDIDLSPNAVRSYGSAVKMLTKLISDNTLIASITNNDILRWRKALLLGEMSYQPGQRGNKTGRAVRTADYYMGVLRQILNVGYSNKFINHRPHEGVKNLRKGNVKPDPLLKHEYQQLIDAAPDAQKNLWQTATYTGRRPGELCALAWEDISLTKDEISISRNLTQAGIFLARRKPERAIVQ